MARTCAGRPGRLLAQVFGIAAATTAVLSLDATVVLLSPVVFATASRLGAWPRPHVYACTHLANSGSLLRPVSNLINRLAFAPAGVSFTRFAGLMLLPWLVVVGHPSTSSSDTSSPWNSLRLPTAAQPQSSARYRCSRWPPLSKFIRCGRLSRPGVRRTAGLGSRRR